MKKKILLLVVAVLAVVATLSLAACDLFTVIGGDADVSEDYSVATTKQNVADLRNGNGYSITYKLTTVSDTSEEKVEEEMTIAAKGEVYYLKTSEGEQYIDLSQDGYASIFTKGEEGWTLTVKAYTDSYTKENAKEEYANAEAYFTMYSEMGGGLEKSEATIVGRSCDKYAMGLSGNLIVISASGKTEFCVDKATGICLKWAADASVSAGSDKGSGGANFECIAFADRFVPVIPTAEQIVETIDERIAVDQGTEGEESGEDVTNEG